MLFTDLQSQKPYINNIIEKSRNNQSIFSISSKTRNVPSTIITQPTIQENTNIQTPSTKKMKWGEPTWFLFHTLAEKVREESFSQIRVELLNTIYSICANLPCPDCAEHASAYMNGINYKAIQTKQQLKQMLYSFHNTINAKKGFSIFPANELDSKYSNMGLIRVIYNFMPYFQDKSKSIRMIANDFHRSRIAEQLKKWFNANIKYFEN
jgi:hypothetical protein